MSELVSVLESLRQQKIKDSLFEFCKNIPIPGTPVNDLEDCDKFYAEILTPAQHQQILIDRLQDVADGKIKRLMVMMPPGSAKSSYASVAFPPWFMGKYPNKNIIMTTYGSDLARKFGRKCRQIVRSKEYVEAMGCGLTGDNAAVDDWSLTNGSTYMSGGILSSITGNRADGIIIDDPFKGREDADSEVIRKKTWDEYQSSLMTRLKPKGWQIIINTRWHMADLSGQILPENYKGESGWVIAQDGSEWYVLCIQAQCERDDDPLGRKVGEYLWTDWFPVTWWEQTKRTQSTPSERNWSALYQQRPSPDAGLIFLSDWIRLWPAYLENDDGSLKRDDRGQPIPNELPDFQMIFLSLDGAFSEKTTADYSCLLTLGVFKATEGSPRHSVMLIDCYMEQVNYPTLRDEVLLQYQKVVGAKKQTVDGIIVEDKASGSALIPELRNALIPVYPFQPGSLDKVARANLVSHLVRDGFLWIPESDNLKRRGQPKKWLSKWYDQMIFFPSAKHDDAVDATTQALSVLDKMGFLRGKSAPARELTFWEKKARGSYSGDAVNTDGY